MFDEFTRTVARRTTDRRTFLKAAGVSVLGAALGPTLLGDSAVARQNPTCNPLCVGAKSGACAAIGSYKLAKCSGACKAKGTAGGVACAVCLGYMAGKSQIDCFNKVLINCCTCGAGTTACDEGYFFGRECCTTEEECALFGCSAKCPVCTGRNFLTNSCDDSCPPETSCCPNLDGTGFQCCSSNNQCHAFTCTDCPPGTKACPNAGFGHGCCNDVTAICFTTRDGRAACCKPGAATCTPEACDNIPVACCANPQVCA